MNTPITEVEILDKYEVLYDNRTPKSWSQKFTFIDDNSFKYTGKLNWHEETGYFIVWYGVNVPKESFREDFGYSLEKILSGKTEKGGVNERPAVVSWE